MQIHHKYGLFVFHMNLHQPAFGAKDEKLVYYLFVSILKKEKNGGAKKRRRNDGGELWDYRSRRKKNFRIDILKCYTHNFIHFTAPMWSIFINKIQYVSWVYKFFPRSIRFVFISAIGARVSGEGWLSGWRAAARLDGRVSCYSILFRTYPSLSSVSISTSASAASSSLKPFVILFRVGGGVMAMAMVLMPIISHIHSRDIMWFLVKL